MRHSLKLFTVLTGALLAATEGALASQPPDVVTSDPTNFSTAMGQAALYNNTGNYNTASGYVALQWNTVGYWNTASGAGALYLNVSGFNNTASGMEALYNNTGGGDNTAIGTQALFSNTIGVANTASGQSALYSNTTGNNNTASGQSALYSNTTGENNTASGVQALWSNTTGSYNTAAGLGALYLNSTGYNNTALGYEALLNNTTGHDNVAAGIDALHSNTSGHVNLAFGGGALYSNTTGSNNIAIGINAGYAVTGSSNIDIGHRGTAGQNGVIHIGASPTQTAVYIAGISTTQLTGAAVYVNSAGQLGVLASSERYKTAIEPMAPDAEKLARLRPVTFHLKSEPDGVLQYGLIAEEVAKVYPELVIRDDTGQIQGVRYDELAPMLLSVVQQQAIAAQLQTSRINALERQLVEIRAAMSRPSEDGAVFARIPR
jgi:hypothetical protein